MWLNDYIPGCGRTADYAEIHIMARILFGVIGQFCKHSGELLLAWLNGYLVEQPNSQVAA